MHQQKIKARISLEIFSKALLWKEYGNTRRHYGFGDTIENFILWNSQVFKVISIQTYKELTLSSLSCTVCLHFETRLIPINIYKPLSAPHKQGDLARNTGARKFKLRGFSPVYSICFTQLAHYLLESRAPLSIASPNLLVGLFISCILKLLLPEKALWRSEHKTYLSCSVVYDYCYCLVHPYFELERKIYNLYLPPDLD
jgi:hypothetical protein